MANLGRYGPYVQHGSTYANLDAGDDVLTVGLNRAVALIADKASKGGGRGPRSAPGFGGRGLGDHPQKGGAVVVKSGRYGPYVSHGGVNATLPNDKSPETLTLEEALVLLDAKAGKSPAKAPKKAAATRRKTAGKKAASGAKKPAARKTPTRARKAAT
jgi:DNA topoisomerase-1